MLGRIGALEISIILFILLLLIGPKKIPQMVRGMMDGVKEFKKASKEEE